MSSTNRTEDQSFERRHEIASTRLENARTELIEAEIRLLQAKTRWHPILVFGGFVLGSVALGVLLSA